jgi:hypothetical protein
MASVTLVTVYRVERATGQKAQPKLGLGPCILGDRLELTVSLSGSTVMYYVYLTQVKAKEYEGEQSFEQSNSTIYAYIVIHGG